MSDQAIGSRVRIGELSRRTGVSDHVLRAWERRYGLLEPVRSEGGYRLYSAGDERRVRTMVRLLESGLAPAEAARVTRTPMSRHPGSASADRSWDESRVVARIAEDLRSSVRRIDDAGTHLVLDELLSTLTVEAALRDVLLPFLHDLGDRWERGEASIAEEHFASQLLRGRMASLAVGAAGGSGPAVLLACPPGERHDIALLAFGLVLGRRGRAITFLGADTPLESLDQLLDGGDYQAVVLSASTPQRFRAAAAGLTRLGSRARLLLAGPGATPQVLAATGAESLEGDPVTAATSLAAD